jgi:hypothetical protein
MAETPSKVPVRTEKPAAAIPQVRHPFESLRREIDRMFDDFDRGFWRSPLRSSLFDIVPFRRVKRRSRQRRPSMSRRPTRPTRSLLTCQAWTRRTSR